MRFQRIWFSSLAILFPLAGAHEGVAGAPRLFGLGGFPGLKLRSNSVGALHVHEAVRIEPRRVENRQAARRCGRGIGACAAGLCCSGAGFCGTTIDHCAAPDCQFNYGPACDANIIPPGASTASISRPKLGSVKYGGYGLTGCTVPGTIALTFDDGPFTHTGYILDLLKKYKAKATFFITGNNLGKGEIDNAAYDWVSIIRTMHAEGHQIASHTWSHQDLSKLPRVQRLQQMHSNEMALRNILGFFPTYMRPPYSSCDHPSGCQSDMEELGYHITSFDLDTEDYLNTHPHQVNTPKNNFRGNISKTTAANGDWLVIGHDIHYQTAYNLTEYMLQTLLAQNYKPVTVGECLNDPRENWYRSSSGSVFTATPTRGGGDDDDGPPTAPASGPPRAPTAVSEDAKCAGQSGRTCLKSAFGDCCSHAGWCGKTDAHCGDGCQPGFGACSSRK